MSLLLWAALAMLVVLPGTLLGIRRRYLIVSVSGSSMEPTLRAGQGVLARRCSGCQVRAGDVVIVQDVEGLDPGPGRKPLTAKQIGRSAPHLIKRVLARAGDPVPHEQIPALRDTAEVQIPQGRIVLIGDNSLSSNDSRHHGYYLEQHIIGKMIRRLT